MTIITIDGPAGTGKSTIAKKLADALGFVYFDTGAMYRAVTYLLLREHVRFEDVDTVQYYLERLDFRIANGPSGKCYYLGQENVSEEIRSHAVTKHVSIVSTLPIVRQQLVALQHKFAESTNAVFEGRDTGTVVFPDAEYKFYLTASAHVRAERRYQELDQKGKLEGAKLEDILADIERRDQIDSTREISPLRQAADAVLIDTSHMSIEQVLEKMLQVIKPARVR